MSAGILISPRTSLFRAAAHTPEPQSTLTMMHNPHDTFFQKVRQKGENQLTPCGDIIFFRIKKDGIQSLLHAPMQSGAFSVLTVTDGTATLSVNYRTAPLHKESLIFLTPGMVVSLSDADTAFILEGVCFTPAFFDDLSSHVPVYNQMISYRNEHPLPLLSLTPSASAGVSQMMHLYATIRDAQLHRNELQMYLSNLLLLHVAELLHDACPTESGKVSHAVELYRAFRKLLADHYATEHYIPFYAGNLCISPTYLSRIVRQVSGRTVNEHITHMLLTEARRMLDCTDDSIKQIADALGFADQASFGKFFREQMGMPPSAYRTDKK